MAQCVHLSNRLEVHRSVDYIKTVKNYLLSASAFLKSKLVNWLSWPCTAIDKREMKETLNIKPKGYIMCDIDIYDPVGIKWTTIVIPNSDVFRNIKSNTAHYIKYILITKACQQLPRKFYIKRCSKNKLIWFVRWTRQLYVNCSVSSLISKRLNRVKSK